MSTKNALIGAGAVIIAAVIGYFSLKSDSKPGTIILQKTDSGTNNYANRDVNQAGRDVITAGKDVTVNNFYEDTLAKKRKKAGNTYNVISYNQKGGITAAKVTVIKKVDIVVPDDQLDNLKIPDNYQIKIDTAIQLITIQPKAGAWTKPFIGIPRNEKGIVNPHFGSKNRNITAMSKGTFISKGDSLYAMTTDGLAATKDFYYSLHYDFLPSYIIFGNNPGPLYRANFK